MTNTTPSIVPASGGWQGSGLMAGKVAVVTGAASGNGRAIALAFAEAGARCVIVADVLDSPREGGVPTHQLIQKLGVDSEFVRCDITSVADLTVAVDTAERLGGIDVMVNNAGTFSAGPFLDVEEKTIDRLLDINVKGVFLGCQVAARPMVERGRGVIINMSSVAGLRGSPSSAAYGMSKGAVRSMSHSLAAELGPFGVRVNVIHPGFIDTEMTRTDLPPERQQAGRAARGLPLTRKGLPEDVAGIALFLASDLSNYVHASELVVDGGLQNVL